MDKGPFLPLLLELLWAFCLFLRAELFSCWLHEIKWQRIIMLLGCWCECCDGGALPLKCVGPFGSCSAISKRCQNLLLQIYLHFPEVIQHVTLPEGTFSSGGAAHSNSCKVSCWFFFFIVVIILPSVHEHAVCVSSSA